MAIISNEAEMSVTVRDMRPATWFWLNNNIIDTYGEKIGAPGLALYTCLARYANGNGQCWPSIRTLAKKVKVDIKTARKYLDILSELKIIHRTERMSPSGDHLSTLYTLLGIEGGVGMAPPPVGAIPTEQDLLNKKNLGSSPIVPTREDGSAAEEGIDYVGGLFPDGPPGEGEVSKGRELRQKLGTTLVTSPSEDDDLGKGKPRTKAGDAEEVLTYLNRITGRNYRAPGQIAVRLSQGVTVKELTLVIDYLDATRGVEWKRDWFDQDAPFRKGNFDKNLEKAKGWHERRTPQRTLEPSPTPPTHAPVADADLLALMNDTITERSPNAPR